MAMRRIPSPAVTILPLWLAAVLVACAPATPAPTAAEAPGVVAVATVSPSPAPPAEEPSDEPAPQDIAPRRIAPHHGARLAAAEQAFEAGDFAQASLIYRELCQAEARAVRGYACYRAAWSERARGDDIGALELMARLLDLLDPPEDEHEKRLRKATVTDLPPLYARVGQASKARAFFARHLEPAELPAALSRLAEAYDDEGKAGEAATVRAQIP
jgi:hypothetical protein